MSVLPEVIYKFNVILINRPTEFLLVYVLILVLLYAKSMQKNSKGKQSDQNWLDGLNEKGSILWWLP